MLNSVQYRINKLEGHVYKLREAAHQAQRYIDKGMTTEARDVLNAVLRGVDDE